MSMKCPECGGVLASEDGIARCTNCEQAFVAVRDGKTNVALELQSIRFQLRALPEIRDHLGRQNHRLDKAESAIVEIATRKDERQQMMAGIYKVIILTGALTSALVAVADRIFT